jgi:hypothetical protein
MAIAIAAPENILIKPTIEYHAATPEIVIPEMIAR